MTKDEYADLANLIVQNNWSQTPRIQHRKYTISQIRGTAFDSDYSVYRIQWTEWYPTRSPVIGNTVPYVMIAKYTTQNEIHALKLLTKRHLAVPVVYHTILGSNGDYMMYMKQMAGDELYTLTQEQPWKVAVEKLAEIHLTFWRGECAFETVSQQVHGSKSFMTWIQRASEHASFKEKWRVAFDRAIERVHLAPKTLIHGDFFPTNILVDGRDICIIDWADATVFGYMMDVGRLTAIIDKKTLKPMCPCVDKVISAYYNRVKDKLQMDYSEYLQDIYAAQFIELCKYYQPVHAFGIQQEYASLLERRLDSIAEEYLA